MGIPVTQPSAITLRPSRGVAELSIPCDQTGFTGVSGIHFNRTFTDFMFLGSLPLARANNSGAVYFSDIHGGLGSDAVSPASAPLAGQNPNRPAFANPEVTGFFTSGPNMADPKANGFINTEKVQRTNSDGQFGAASPATIWEPLQGRRRLAFSLWIESTISPGADFYTLEVYNDVNVADKVAGRFGVGAGFTDPFNAQLVYQYGPVLSAQPNVPASNMASSFPIDLSAATSLYLVLRNLTGINLTRAVGSVRFVD